MDLESRPPANERRDTSPALVIREASADDLPTVVELIGLSFEAALDTGAVARIIDRLNPEKTLAWLAFAGDRAVGLNRVHFRTVYWNGAPHSAAYWVDLFVRRDAKRLMAYPRFVFAMQAAMTKQGRELLYVAGRRQNVVEGNVKLGFQRIGDLTVLAKPLRPLRLICKRRGAPEIAARLTSPVDWLYRVYLKLRRKPLRPPFRAEHVPWDSPAVEHIAALWDRPEDCRVHQRWTAALLRERYATTLEGTDYWLVGIRRGEEHVSAAIVRVAERGPRLRIGVIMDLVSAPGDRPALRHALAEAERRLLQSGCEAILFLDGLGEDVRQAFQSTGYLKTSERYTLLCHSAGKDLQHEPYGRAQNWRFSFCDHDAF